MKRIQIRIHRRPGAESVVKQLSILEPAIMQMCSEVEIVAFAESYVEIRVPASFAGAVKRKIQALIDTHVS